LTLEFLKNERLQNTMMVLKCVPNMYMLQNYFRGFWLFALRISKPVDEPVFVGIPPEIEIAS
jgi:hypothetical protein